MQKNSDTGSVRLFSHHIYWSLIPVTLIVLLDEFLKYRGITTLPTEGEVASQGILQFAIHQNWGIAFDIPFKLELVILFSVLIGLGLAHAAYKNWKQHPNITVATLMILIGALGNLYDRIVYGFTVDYIILFERSAINLSDIVIVTGVFFLLWLSRRAKNKDHTLTKE
ncbi:MAG: Lipoprotein signal peptidase [Candidatus Uhrbacteria bacterium GW2011_GWF2_39_13]|uniref:Lipoprotein signal peptidase n=1 Tax=Candidatus Uhrbacteria bacterium GW2011_GWF2_39_13 TaxID=1618995 RepID=A0A0G0Q1K2_9BACT|nr:MAG: Lipoprotein signal peptidase [Candidatus Uhrbacteria bacterium GW2011_GWF2_39_13]HAU65761.1 hypothetical protein [Candidatus Uhrbacteria bacterium]